MQLYVTSVGGPLFRDRNRNRKVQIFKSPGRYIQNSGKGTQSARSSLATGLRAQEPRQRVLWALWGLVLFCCASDAAQMHQKNIKMAPRKACPLWLEHQERGSAAERKFLDTCPAHRTLRENMASPTTHGCNKVAPLPAAPPPAQPHGVTLGPFASSQG